MDTDALDRVFVSGSDETPRSNGAVTFRYASRRVTVSADVDRQGPPKGERPVRLPDGRPGSVYGRLAVGGAVVSYFDVNGDWIALVVGLVVVAIAVRILFVGWLINVLVSLVGIGALALVLVSGYRARRRQRASRGDAPIT